MRGFAVFVLLLCASGARAQTGMQDPLAACLDPVLAHVAQRGAHVASSEAVFLRESEARSFDVVFERAECVAFLAIAGRNARDLNLVLHTREGLELAQDFGPDAHPYVRFCGAAGLRAVVTLQMYAGQGEARLVRITNAPPAIDQLDARLGDCVVPIGGVRRDPPDLGPTPGPPSIDDAVSAIDRFLEEFGYSVSGGIERARLGNDGRHVRRETLDAGRCYGFAAVSGPLLEDLNLAALAPDGRTVARDDGEGRDAVIVVCAETSGVYVLETTGDAPALEFALRRYGLDAQGEFPVGVLGTSRARYAELRTRMQQRGMQVRPLAWGFVGPGDELAMPLRLEAGRCYGLGALAAEELGDGDLDLSLLDDHRAVTAWDVGPGSTPLVYHCPVRSGVFRVVGKTFGTYGARYLVLVGEAP